MAWLMQFHHTITQPPSAWTHRVPIPTHGAGTTSSRVDAGLDFSHLDHTVQELFFAGLAPALQRCYRTGTNGYLECYPELGTRCRSQCYSPP